MDFLTAKFWSRIWAIAIDFLVIGAFGYALGMVFEDYFISIGSYGHLIGLSICILYFTIGNSLITKGQTVGKLALNIHVVNSKGEFLLIQKSLLRSLIFFTPLFLVNFRIPDLEGNLAIYIVKGLLMSIIFGFVIIYILNKSTRQTLHDIFINSYVTETIKRENLAELEAIKKWILYIYGITVIVIMASVVYTAVSSKSAENNSFSTYNKIKNIDGVIDAGTSNNVTRSYFGDSVIVYKYYAVRLLTQSLPETYEAAGNDKRIKEAVKIVLENVSDIDSLDYIDVHIMSGFNIGIARKSRSFNISKTPTEWKESFKNEN